MSNSIFGSNSPIDRVRQRKRPAVRDNSRPGASARVGLTPSDEALLLEIMAEPMDFMDSPEFRKPDAERAIYEKPAPIARPDVTWYRPLMDDLSEKEQKQRQARNGSVLLTAAQERVIFLQFNYARWRVRQIQEGLQGRSPTTDEAREMLRWYRLARKYREQISEINLALVLAMARRVRLGETDFPDLIGEGNMALMRSVDKFDCGRGFKFSTYACRAILKAFSRFGIKLVKHRQRFPSEFDPEFERSNHLETVRLQHERDSAAEVRFLVESDRAELTDVERRVILHRFGLDSPAGHPSLTLEQVGQMVGLTKERVRQIQNKALEKLRLALEDLRGETLPPTVTRN
ncbi:MAG: sigma-70 family RNA polymerase sigma factor [Planctomycetes bacterium]|nr:sigma-70 family RNA polymerase sigma factor [Planctomycetota bacterium]